MHMPPASELERWVLTLPVVAQGIDRIAVEVENEARALADARAHDTGEYRRNIRRDLNPGPGQTVTAHEDYSATVEVGTGLYGPKHKRIVPLPSNESQVLAWKRDGVWHYAKSVRGKKPQHVMRDAARAVADRHGLRFTDHLGDGSRLG